MQSGAPKCPLRHHNHFVALKTRALPNHALLSHLLPFLPNLPKGCTCIAWVGAPVGHAAIALLSLARSLALA
jgi:hypothetical protein